MAIGTDWITDAATEIAVSQNAEQLTGYFYAIIQKHCPFDYAISYEPVNLSKEIAIKRLRFALLAYTENCRKENQSFISIKDVFEAAREVATYD